jgi:(p)ppGpp synthase/HD superfamily hydrolase
VETEAMTLEESIARRVHTGAFDKGNPPAPYIDHVARVAAAVEPQYRAVAWLHDVIEDTNETRETLLAAGVSAETLDAVEVLTKGETEIYPTYIERVASSGNVAALAVKRADLRDNLRPGKLGSAAKYQAALARLGG